MKKQILKLVPWIIGLALVFNFVIGYARSKDHYLNLQLFAKVMNLIHQFYVEKVDTKRLIYGGIKGMLKELDPHTYFLPPDVYNEFENETSGRFGGLGIEVTIQDGFLTIISPIEDSPAWRAGLKAGDKIISIDGLSTKNMSLVESSQLMRGKKGSKIRLSIIRQGVKIKEDYVIKREIIKIKSVKHSLLDDTYLYLRLTNFTENSSREVKKLLEKVKKDSREISGVILDLRNNPGGLLSEAIQISDFFLEEGIIVSTLGRNKSDKKVIYAKDTEAYTNFPIIVLINEYSASASEIVAGALKDNNRALVMGKRSFGKGSVQSVIRMEDGSGLKMTVARYYTPNGTSIQAQGIKPDIEIEEVDKESFKKAVIKRVVKRESDIDGHLLSEVEKKRKPVAKQSTSEQKKNKASKSKLLDDFQIRQAYNYLKAHKVMKKTH